MDTKFIWDEDLLLTVIMSSIGNEQARLDYKNAHLDVSSKWVDAINYMSGMRFTPVMEGDKVVGTHSVFVSESDFGGSIPKLLIRQKAAKGVHDFFEDCVKGAAQV